MLTVSVTSIKHLHSLAVHGNMKTLRMLFEDISLDCIFDLKEINIFGKLLIFDYV